jgi:phage terminase small subunit
MSRYSLQRPLPGLDLNQSYFIASNEGKRMNCTINGLKPKTKTEIAKSLGITVPRYNKYLKDNDAQIKALWNVWRRENYCKPVYAEIDEMSLDYQALLNRYNDLLAEHEKTTNKDISDFEQVSEKAQDTTERHQEILEELTGSEPISAVESLATARELNKIRKAQMLMKAPASKTNHVDIHSQKSVNQGLLIEEKKSAEMMKSEIAKQKSVPNIKPKLSGAPTREQYIKNLVEDEPIGPKRNYSDVPIRQETGVFSNLARRQESVDLANQSIGKTNRPVIKDVMKSVNKKPVSSGRQKKSRR